MSKYIDLNSMIYNCSSPTPYSSSSPSSCLNNLFVYNNSNYIAFDLSNADIYITFKNKVNVDAIKLRLAYPTQTVGISYYDNNKYVQILANQIMKHSNSIINFSRTISSRKWKMHFENGKNAVVLFEIQFLKYSGRFLIKQLNNIYIIKPEFYKNLGEVELTKELFDKYGTSNINNLLLERNVNSIIQENSTKLSEGKIFEFNIDNDFKSIKEVK